MNIIAGRPLEVKENATKLAWAPLSRPSSGSSTLQVFGPTGVRSYGPSALRVCDPTGLRYQGDFDSFTTISEQRGEAPAWGLRLDPSASLRTVS